MLSSCCDNNMLSIYSTSNEWPQKHMEKPSQEQEQQQQQQALKCPRCDSANTKFCYYNNYSLSQPRHFCKACKRYWTRGGTLRNVPVGGGCRKNKRVKRPTTSSGANPVTIPPLSQPQIDTHRINNNPLLYGLNSNDPFSRIGTSTCYDLGLGFSSGGSTNDYPNGNFNSFSSYSNSTPTIASLLAAGLYNNHQHKFLNGGVKNSETTLGSFQDLQMTDVKVPLGQNHLEQIGLSDPALYWSSKNVGAWHDPTNIGSSVTPLIPTNIGSSVTPLI